jgi:biotin operon repressor
MSDLTPNTNGRLNPQLHNATEPRAAQDAKSIGHDGIMQFSTIRRAAEDIGRALNVTPFPVNGNKKPVIPREDSWKRGLNKFDETLFALWWEWAAKWETRVVGFAVGLPEPYGVVDLDLMPPDKDDEIAKEKAYRINPDRLVTVLRDVALNRLRIPQNAPCALTGRGLHYWVRLPDDMTSDEVRKWISEQLRDGQVVCNFDGTDTPFIVQAELKGWNKGYVLAPPSLNAPSGRCYSWLTEPPKSRDDLPLWTPLIAPKEARGNTKSKSSSKRQKPIKVGEGVIDVFVALLAPHWIEGKRHRLALFLPGFLGKAGWSWNDAERFLRKIAQIADDEELDDDRLRALKDTFEKLSHAPDEVAGLSRLAEEKLLPDWVLTALQDLVTLTRQTDKEGQEAQRDCPFCQLSDDELFERARPVLDAENPVVETAKRLCEASNIIAEDRNAQLLLLIATTRLLPTPAHALVVGTPGVGKSVLVSVVASGIPPCRHKCLIGTSARALLFHNIQSATVLEWLELPDTKGDTIHSQIIRTVLWQNPNQSDAHYLTVEYTQRGYRRLTLRLPRQITLLSTRTGIPTGDNGQTASRFLIVEAEDNPDKRRTVLVDGIGATWESGEIVRHNADELREPVRAFQEWAQRRNWKVVIPYARALTSLLAELPPTERDFRDAQTLLTLIAAHAIWNFQRREHFESNDTITVVATLDDYAVVRELLAPTWSKGRPSSVSQGEQRVIELLQTNDGPLTTKEIAQKLGISESAARNRLNELKRKGFTTDETVEGKRSKAWRLEAETSIALEALPTVEMVRQHWQPEPPTPPENPITACHEVGSNEVSGRRLASEGVPTLKTPVNTGTFSLSSERRLGNGNKAPSHSR